MKPNLIKPANNFIEADMVKSNTRLEVDLGEFTPGIKEASLAQMNLLQANLNQRSAIWSLIIAISAMTMQVKKRSLLHKG
jgi:hypothetical protein